jgi:hypothetical protein
MRDSDTFTAHAARCRQEADDAILDNVRERALRSEAAWTAMAARSLKSEASRDAKAAQPVEEVAPEVFQPRPPLG